MEEKNVFWSLIPLILIIVLPWLVGYWGARKKKAQQEQEQGMPTIYREAGTGEAESYDEEEEWLFGASGEQPVQGSYPMHGEYQEVRRYQDIPAPEVSSKPIKPKWWGA